MSDVHVGPEGIGLAVGTEPVRGERGERSSNARFLRTVDGGVTGHAIQPDIGRWGRMRAWPSWPPEAIDDIAVLAGGVMAFAWEDPWLFEGPHSHIVLSADGRASWRYARLPDGCSELVCGPGPLRVFGGAGRVAGGFVVRSDSGSFRRETARLDWNRPPGYWDHPLPIRLPQFTSEAEGLAIVATWPREQPPRPREELPPPLVGLARSEDGGASVEGGEHVGGTALHRPQPPPPVGARGSLTQRRSEVRRRRSPSLSGFVVLMGRSPASWRD